MPALLPTGTKVAHKTGTGARNYNDAGIVFRGDDPLFILTVYTEHVPVEMPDGMPGAAAAQQTINKDDDSKGSAEDIIVTAHSLQADFLGLSDVVTQNQGYLFSVVS